MCLATASTCAACARCLVTWRSFARSSCNFVLMSLIAVVVFFSALSLLCAEPGQASVKAAVPARSFATSWRRAKRMAGMVWPWTILVPRWHASILFRRTRSEVRRLATRIATYARARSLTRCVVVFAHQMRSAGVLVATRARPAELRLEVTRCQLVRRQPSRHVLPSCY